MSFSNPVLHGFEEYRAPEGAECHCCSKTVTVLYWRRTSYEYQLEGDSYCQSCMQQWIEDLEHFITNFKPDEV